VMRASFPRVADVYVDVTGYRGEQPPSTRQKASVHT